MLKRYRVTKEAIDFSKNQNVFYFKPGKVWLPRGNTNVTLNDLLLITEAIENGIVLKPSKSKVPVSRITYWRMVRKLFSLGYLEEVLNG